jgi:hypothetical protein
MARTPVQLRVHLATVGFEVRRVTEPLVRLRADRAYLFTLNRHDAAKEYFEKVHRTLREEYSVIEVRDRYAEIWDLGNMLEAYHSVIRAEGALGNATFVNVSTGTKIAAMAGLTAAMFWGSTAYYATTGYEGKTEVVNDVKYPPVARFDVMPAPQRFVLLELARLAAPAQKEFLIEAARSERLMPSKQSSSTSTSYRRLDLLLEPLVAQGLVEVRGVRRSARVQLTDEGWSAVRILQ